MTDRYAVIGNPVAHSKSPFIHAEFARQTAQDLVYERILAPLDRFASAVEDFRAEGGIGLNVTLPFKLEAFRLANECSARAQEAQAVNTLKFEGSAAYGDNTDGVGLVRDIQLNLGFHIEGRDVLVMGAGGAAQGALGALLDEKPARLVVANRTVEKAELLAERWRTRRGLSAEIMQASGYAELAAQQFDLIVNCTAASLSDTAPDLPQGMFARDCLAYDMVYGKGMTPFLELALSQGAGRLADGIGMLVEQAAESFLVWRGVRPQTRPVIEALKAR
ncbi:MAG TPA: shikimate dehydrogenase [Burkholderiales bacterium]|nr:shikimate dehydrogenase [Burkholderiales bacterium]